MKPSNDESRVVPLVGLSLEWLKEHAKVRLVDAPLLFPGKDKNNVPMDLRTPWLTALKKANIKDFRFHDLRHSAPSYLAIKGPHWLRLPKC
jgi:integrase